MRVVNSDVRHFAREEGHTKQLRMEGVKFEAEHPSTQESHPAEGQCRQHLIAMSWIDTCILQIVSLHLHGHHHRALQRLHFLLHRGIFLGPGTIAVQMSTVTDAYKYAHACNTLLHAHTCVQYLFYARIFLGGLVLTGVQMHSFKNADIHK